MRERPGKSCRPRPVDGLADGRGHRKGGRDAKRAALRVYLDVAENLAFDQARVAQPAPAAKEPIMTIAEELKAQGLEQGREQGLVQGREQGLVQGLVLARRQTLERLMTVKFGSLSDRVSARIQAADLEVLDVWLERILSVDTPDAVVEP
jgi:flagellar biosynthesis/type III secretory pathway protein FliH